MFTLAGVASFFKPSLLHKNPPSTLSSQGIITSNCRFAAAAKGISP